MNAPTNIKGRTDLIPTTGDPLIAVRPTSSPDTTNDDHVYYTGKGYPVATVYYSEGVNSYLGEISNEAPDLGLNGELIGQANPRLPLTAPTVEHLPLTREQVQAEVEAQLTETGWSFVDRA